MVGSLKMSQPIAHSSGGQKANVAARKRKRPTPSFTGTNSHPTTARRRSLLLVASLAATTVNAMSERIHLPGAAGSGPYEAVRDWIAAFEAKYPEADFTVSSVGSGAAQSALWQDIDCESKPIVALCAGNELVGGATVWGIGGGTLDEQDYIDHASRGLQQLPALGGPILVTYSKDVTGNLGSTSDAQLNMTFDVISGIFNGKITTWDDPLIVQANPNLSEQASRNQPISVVVRSDQSGMSQTFTEAIAHATPTWPKEAVGKLPEWPLSNLTHSSDSSVTESVPQQQQQCACDANGEPTTINTTVSTPSRHYKADGQTGIGLTLLRRPYSVGYLELGYFEGLSQFVSQAHVSPPNYPDAFVPANADTIQTTMGGLSDALQPDTLSLTLVDEDTPLGGFPITRYVYWYIKKSPTEFESCYQAWLLYQFIEWSFTDPLAEEIALSHGWVVPPSSVVEKALAKLREVECSDNSEGQSENNVLRVEEYVPPPYRAESSEGSKTTAIVVTSVLIGLVFVTAVGAYYYVERKKKQADSVWAVKPEELHFDDPPVILGRGTFGLVLLAEYRGTHVAVKRVIPPRRSAKDNKSSNQGGWERNSLLGEGDMSSLYSSQIIPTSQLSSNKPTQTDVDSRNLATGLTNSKHSIDESDPSKTETPTRRPARRHTFSVEPSASQRLRSSYFDFENLPTSEREGMTESTSDLKNGRPRRRMSDGSWAGKTESTSDIKNGRPRRRMSDGSWASRSSGDLKTGRPRRRASHESIASDLSSVIEEEILMVDAKLFEADQVIRNLDKGDSNVRNSEKRRRHSISGVLSRSRQNSIGRYWSRKERKSSTQNEHPAESNRGSTLQNKHSGESVVSWDVDEDGNDDPELGEPKNKGPANFSSTTKPMISGDFGKFSSRSGSNQRRKLVSAFYPFGRKNEYSQLKADFIVEMRQISRLRHPCITTVMGTVISKKTEPMLVMEYMDHGSLYDILHNPSMVMTGELMLPILRDIAQGMRFLHASNPKVIHGDLKSPNVLVDSKFRAKVADFGFSQKKRVGATGTPLWMAPELLRGASENTTASDVYSFGIILYEVYSRKDPHEGENIGEILCQVADPSINKRPPVPDGCPPKIASIMTDCILAEADTRPDFEELDHRLKRLDIENVEPAILNFSMQRKKKEQRAARSEEILFEVFPLHVAKALQEGRKVEAEAFDCVTVFFSDIVGYTTISATMSARKVSDMLDRLYQRFDELSVLHEVFKIETIGDAYIGATNIAKDQPDHAAIIARFAIDAMKAAGETLIDCEDPSKGYVVIRVGFHSGQVVADVIGSRSPKYTLFGDTVNTASRMESNSKPRRIQCSDRSAELVQIQDPSIIVSSRGKIHLKGKGEMNTFWVKGRREQGTSSRLELKKDDATAENPVEQAKVCVEQIEGNGAKQIQ